MITHRLWRADAGMGYLPGHSDYSQRPYVLDSWDTEHRHVQRSILNTPYTGLMLRTLRQKHRIKIESLIAMEQYQ